jgi:hypothetical protein
MRDPAASSAFLAILSRVRITLNRPSTAPAERLRAAEIDTAERPAAFNASSRRSSSSVQGLFLFAVIDLPA